VLSIIVPIYNEEGNLRQLQQEIFAVLDSRDVPFEVIFIDDGSSDGSAEILRQLAGEDQRVKVVQFRRNFGQTAALMAGIKHARGDILIPMDGDLQNDPQDIPRLLEKLEEGYDVVSGWRRSRQDKTISRVLPSMLANRLISLISGVTLHDYGCTLKAYRSDVLKDVKLYGEMHRFIPIYSSWYGGRVCEIAVNHRPRIHGTSKYGWKRTFKVILDLMVVQFLSKYDTKPIYVFGAVGLFIFVAAVISGSTAIGLRLFAGISFISTPLPLLTALCLILSIVTILMGLLAELLVRIYYESSERPTYLIREEINLDNDNSADAGGAGRP